MALQHSGDFDPIVARNGTEGITLAGQESPDVILIDLMMPGLDGIATCRKIKQNPKLKDIPIIILTAKTEQYEVDRAIKMGAFGYLQKPFDPLKLADQINAIIDGAKTDEL